MFLRRLGPSLDKSLCSGGHSCPDILEMDSGDFAVVGTDITAEAVVKLPPGTGCGPNERVVRIPRHILVQARLDIPRAP